MSFQSQAPQHSNKCSQQLILYTNMKYRSANTFLWMQNFHLRWLNYLNSIHILVYMQCSKLKWRLSQKSQTKSKTLLKLLKICIYKRFPLFNRETSRDFLSYMMCSTWPLFWDTTRSNLFFMLSHALISVFSLMLWMASLILFSRCSIDVIGTLYTINSICPRR